MRYALIFAACGIAHASRILPRAPPAPEGKCCFSLGASAPGLGSAVVEEDTIGQNRVYSSYPDGFYCMDPAEPGKLYDSIGHTCIISNISKQFQCTLGLTSPVAFTVSDEGAFLAGGSNDFYACKASGPGDDGSYLIYADSKEDTYGCVPITLATTDDKCAGGEEAPVLSEAPYVNNTGPAASSVYDSAPSYTAGPTGATTLSTVSGPAPASSFKPEAPPAAEYTPPAPPAYGEQPEYTPPAPPAYGGEQPPTVVIVTEYAPGYSAPVETQPPVVPEYSVKPGESVVTITTTYYPEPSMIIDPPPKTDVCMPHLTPNYYQAPSFIIPVSEEAPEVCYGTQFIAQITKANSTVYNFDIPETWEGANCKVIFDFPVKEKVYFQEGYKYTPSKDMDGAFVNFHLLNGTIDMKTTYANLPEDAEHIGNATVVPGNSYTIVEEKCRAGQKLTFKLDSVNGSAIEYFQATGPSPIGLWITKC